MTPIPDHPMSRRALLRAAGAAGLATSGAAALETGDALVGDAIVSAIEVTAVS